MNKTPNTKTPSAHQIEKAIGEKDSYIDTEAAVEAHLAHLASLGLEVDWETTTALATKIYCG